MQPDLLLLCNKDGLEKEKGLLWGRGKAGLICQSWVLCLPGSL